MQGLQTKQGLARNYFDSVNRFSARHDIDRLIHPSRMSTSEKFITTTKKALNRLVDKIGIMTDEAANDYLEGPFLKIKNEPGTMNGAALALVFTCYEFGTREFVMRSENDFSWENLLSILQHPKNLKPFLTGNSEEYNSQEKIQEMEKFIEEFGITGPDLVRYLIFAKNL